MARRKRDSSVNKTKLLRDFYQGNPDAKPREAQAWMKATHNLEVAASLCSKVRQRLTVSTPVTKRLSTQLKAVAGITTEQLMLAVKFARSVGGSFQAKQLIAMLDMCQLGDGTVGKKIKTAKV